MEEELPPVRSILKEKASVHELATRYFGLLISKPVFCITTQLFKTNGAHRFDQLLGKEIETVAENFVFNSLEFGGIRDGMAISIIGNDSIFHLHHLFEFNSSIMNNSSRKYSNNRAGKICPDRFNRKGLSR